MSTTYHAAAAPLFLLVLAGCVAPSPVAEPSPSPTPTPAYELAVPMTAELAAPSESDEWIVFGLAGATSQAVEDPHVLIVLRDEAGAEIARRTIELPTDSLPPSSAWPIREFFRPPSPPASVEATLLGNSATLPASPEVAAQILRTFLDAQGRTIALGLLANSSPAEATVDRLGMLGRDERNGMREVLYLEPVLDRIGPGDRVPFLVLLPLGSEDLEWEVFPIARNTYGSRLPVAILEVRSDRDDQGNPFITAIVHNASQEPAWLFLTAIALDGEEWIAGDSLSLPVPLSAGGRAPFSLRLPGVGLPAEDPVEWLIVAQARPADTGPVVVSSEVVDYSTVGSTLFLRVVLTGGETPGTLSPSARAMIRGEEGQVVSAGWGAGPPSLAPGETAVVTLALPLPGGFDLTLGQLDVQGAGLPLTDPPP
jgi:hypothetical protein